jgi:hypothetical protein
MLREADEVETGLRNDGGEEDGFPIEKPFQAACLSASEQIFEG